MWSHLHETLSNVPQAVCSSEYREKDSDEVVDCKDWSCFRISDILEMKKSLKASANVIGRVKLRSLKRLISITLFILIAKKKLVLTFEIRVLTLRQQSLYISLWTMSLDFFFKFCHQIVFLLADKISSDIHGSNSFSAMST